MNALFQNDFATMITVLLCLVFFLALLAAGDHGNLPPKDLM